MTWAYDGRATFQYGDDHDRLRPSGPVISTQWAPAQERRAALNSEMHLMYPAETTQYRLRVRKMPKCG